MSVVVGELLDKHLDRVHVQRCLEELETMLDAPQNTSTPNDVSHNSFVPAGASHTTSTPAGTSQDPSAPTDTSQNTCTPAGASYNIPTPTGVPQNTSTPNDVSHNSFIPAGASHTISTPADASQDPSTPADASQNTFFPTATNEQLLVKFATMLTDVERLLDQACHNQVLEEWECLKRYISWQCDPGALIAKHERCPMEDLLALASSLIQKARNIVGRRQIPPGVDDSTDLAFFANFHASNLESLLHSWESWKRDRNRIEPRPPKLPKFAIAPIIEVPTTHKCNGWNGEYYSDGGLLPGVTNLFDVSVGKRNKAGYHVGHGNISMLHLWDIGDLSSKYPQYLSLAEFMAGDPSAAFEEYSKCELSSQQPARVKESLYHATGFSLRASRCAGSIQEGRSGMCTACYCIQLDDSLHQRARDAVKQSGNELAPLKTNDRHLKQRYRDEKCKHFQTTHKSDRYTIINLKEANKKLKARLVSALDASVKATKTNDYPELLRNLIDAHELSKLDIEDKSSLLTQPLSDILTGISRCLLHGTRRGRKLTSNEQLFYAALLNVKGPWSQKLVSSVLLGPDIDTSKKYRAKLCEDFDSFDWRANVKAVKECMESYGDRFPDLHKAPGIVSEDASTILRRVDLERLSKSSDFERLHIPEGGLAVRVWGLDGGERVVQSIDQLRTLLKQCSADDIATYVYIWLWIPQVEHAPWFPLRCEITNNKFDRFQIFDWWRELDVEFEKNDLLTIGHVSDGDARLRAADFFLMRELGNGKGAGEWLERRHSGLDHALLNFLKVGITSEGHWKLGFQDYMHLLWRWRRHLLDPKRQLHIGPGLVVNWRHLEGCPHLRGGDLRYSDKQNWNGTERIFSMDTVDWLLSEMESNPSEHSYRGTLTFVWFGYKLRACWLEDSDPLLAIQNAASLMTSLLYWRYWLDQRPKQPAPGCTETYCITRNFMTRETFLDSIISCCTRLLLYVQYRDNDKLRAWKPIGSRVSSCFSEHCFQHIRMKHTNTTAVGAMSAIQHVKHYFAQMKIDALADFELPASKRGITRKVRAHCTEQQRASPEYWEQLTDAKIKAALERGMDEARDYLQSKCNFDSELDLTKREQFFAAPCLHFPKMEGFKKYVSDDVDDVDGVDDVSGTDDGDDAGGGDGGGGAGGADSVGLEAVSADVEVPAVRRSRRRIVPSADAVEALCQGLEWDAAPEVAAADVESEDGNVDNVALSEVPPCGEDEERPPGEDEDTNVGAVVEDLFRKHYTELPAGASTNEQWKAMSKLMSDFNAGKINKGLQEHRKWRFVGQKLFDAANRSLEKKRDKRGVWDVVMIHYDVAVALNVNVMVNRRLVRKQVWRLGNVEGIRLLKQDPKRKDGEIPEDLSGLETDSHPDMVSVDDPKAVFLVRWYHECDDDAKVLSGFQNPRHGCKYQLPIFGDAMEPVVEVSNHTVIESVEMVKDSSEQSVWLLKPENKEMIEEKFEKCNSSMQ